MKKVYYQLTFLTIFCLLLISGTTLEGQNLLGNPSFETGELAPWTEGNGNTVNIIEDAADGTYAAQGNIEQIIDLVAGQAYVWTAQVKCIADCDKNVWIGRKDLAPGGGVVNFNFTDLNEYGEAKVEFVAENSGPHRFWVWGQGDALGYVSDNHVLLTAREYALQNSLLGNPSFETGELAPWTEGNGNTVNIIEDAPDGMFAAQGNIEQIIDLKEGQAYRWTAQARCLDGCDKDMWIGRKDLAPGGGVVNFNFKEFSEWGEATVEFVAENEGPHRFWVWGVGDPLSYASDFHILLEIDSITPPEPEPVDTMGGEGVGDNLLLNPSFETGELTPWAAGNNSTVNLISDATDGETAAQGNIEQIVNLTAGQSYVWTTDVKCLGGCDNGMFIGVRDLVENALVKNFNFSGFTEYMEAKIEFTATSTGEHRFFVFGVGDADYVSDNHVLQTLEGTVEEEPELEIGPVGDNILLNPDFESGELAPWTPGGSDNAMIETEDVANGDFAMRGHIEQIVSLEAGQNYVYSAQAKCVSGCVDNNMWIGRRDLAEGGAVVNFSFKEFSDYMEAKFEFEAESTGEYRFFVFGQGDANYITDNHQLFRLDTIVPEPIDSSNLIVNNLLINPDFEGETLSPWNDNTTNTAMLDTADVQNGNQAARGHLEQIVSLEQGESYVWTAQVKCADGCENNMWIGIRDLVAGALVTNFNFKDFNEYAEAKIEFTSNSTGDHRFFVFGQNDANYLSDNHVLVKVGDEFTSSTYETGTDAEKIEITNYNHGLMVNVDQTLENGYIFAHDLAGRTVYNSPVNGQLFIDKSNFNTTGIYIISVRAGNAIKTQKVFMKN